ncbi:PVC-type heme-binding CxxCH protein [Schlesneria sp. DSM 10557]|uniref:PVC-type heme-binding CxxCH protein n=1 Tax=Schlesneria sp. DSM 10557 TaxID=3044399 RepID=UPI00359FBBF6
MPRVFVVAVVSSWFSVASSMIFAQGLSPDEAVKRMTVPAPFEVQVVASEPLVRQPVCIEFDDRGRLWVIQYLQYPNPEGLKRVEVDRYSRTRYDRVPEPPPHGPRGADRITILSDSDGDGRMDQGHDFVSGLNLATGLAFGHGGVFVLNVPYLLFYPDRNRDDIPDGDPEVLLTGFGMEDAHSVANSLTWGPDGWLYGCQGSTVTANIRGIEFQQGVWRYHPKTREFELFCEGGGNSWGLDFDRTGELLYSTNYGGHVLLHGIQGAYLVKSFAKHGALHNPHAYGYFDHAPHKNFQGGHVTVGGIVYQGDSFPEQFRDTYIAGDLLGHGLYWHSIQPRGSTFQTAHGGELIVANDPWFAPTDVTMGPDGAIYVSDWHDARTAHPDPDAEWDRSNGRIYRVAPRETRSAAPIDFSRLSVTELIALLKHRSQWYVRWAQRELAQRGAGKSELLNMIDDPDETVALQGLWTLHAMGEFTEELAHRTLNSPHPAVRSWTVRFLGDARVISTEMAHQLDEFAEQEPNARVRRQIASSAARFPAAQGMPMINANINRDIDGDDPAIPLMWWWAIERYSVSDRNEVMRRFLRPTLWKSRLGSQFLLPRLIRRYAAEDAGAGLEAVVQLLKSAPSAQSRDSLWSSIFLGRGEVAGDISSISGAYEPSLQELRHLVAARRDERPMDLTLLNLSLSLGDKDALVSAYAEALNPQSETSRRIALLDLLSPYADPGQIVPLLNIAAADGDEQLRLAVVKFLGRFEDGRIPPALIRLHQATSLAPLQRQICDVLLGRKSSAKVWLEAVDHGEVPATATNHEQLQRVALFHDPELDALVRKHWGQLGSSPGEKLAEVRRLSNDLRAAAGQRSAGHALFKTHCASCHQLHGEGTRLGPDLTTANRKDRDFMLISLVDPNSVIRKEYTSLIVQTKDGRVLTGLAAARDDAGVTLINAKNERTTIPLGEIEELNESPVSLMPDDLYKKFTPQQLRDLFSYLESSER